MFEQILPFMEVKFGMITYHELALNTILLQSTWKEILSQLNSYWIALVSKKKINIT